MIKSRSDHRAARSGGPPEDPMTDIAALRDENEQLREFIAASKECATALYVDSVDNENQRLRAAFKKAVDTVEAGGGFTLSMSGCEWCLSKWPKLDGQTIEETRRFAREHAYACQSHPMRAELAALRADLQRVTAERDEALCDAVESGQAARRVWNEATWRKEAAVAESETEARTAEQIAAWLDEVAWNDDGFDDSADISEQTAAAIVEQIRAGAYRATKGGE